MIYKSVLKYTTNLEDISDNNMDTSFFSKGKCPRLSKAIHRLSLFLNSVNFIQLSRQVSKASSMKSDNFF